MILIVMDSTVKISENYVYWDVDQKFLYVKICKEFLDLRENLLCCSRYCYVE